MAKDPAFLFYYTDFLVGTAFMTFEEKGAYIVVLCHLADKVVLSEEDILMLVPKTLWTAIKKKFKVCPEGFYNERLRVEVEKRKAFCNSRRENIKGRYICSTSVDTSVEHMENININKDINKDISKDRGIRGKENLKKTPQTIEERIKQCKAVFEDKEFIESATKSCPDVVFERELAKMETWIRANPQKSNKANWKRFINNWLTGAEREVVKDGRIGQDAPSDRAKKLRAITKVVEV
jgi:hypothetical protein